MSKIKIYEHLTTLYNHKGEEQTAINLKVTLKDDIILITALNKKLRFTLEELLINLSHQERSLSLDQIYNNLKQPLNNVCFNLRVLFQHVQEFLECNGKLIKFRNVKQQDYLNSSLKIQNFMKKQLTKSFTNSQSRLNVQPLVVIKLQNNQYGTLYKTNNHIYIKIHNVRQISNQLKFYEIINQRYGKITQNNFNEIFDFINGKLVYTELAEFYIEVSQQQKQKPILISKQIEAALKIQRFIRKYLFKELLKIKNKKNQINTIATKVVILEDKVAYLIVANLEIDQNLDQIIRIQAKQIEQFMRIVPIYSYKQKLFLKYSIQTLRTGVSSMIQTIRMIKSAQSLHLTTETFEASLGQFKANYDYQSKEREQTLDIRNQISKQQIKSRQVQNILYDIPQGTLNLSSKYYYLVSLIQQKYRNWKEKQVSTYTYEYGKTIQQYSDYSIIHVNIFDNIDKCISEQKSKQQQPERLQENQNNQNIGIFQFRDKLHRYFINFKDSLIIIQCNIQKYEINFNQLECPYLYKLSSKKQQQIFSFLKDFLFKVSLMIETNPDIILLHQNLSNILQASFIIKIQKKVRIVQLQNRLLQRSKSILLRIMIQQYDFNYYRTIYRLKGNQIKIICNSCLVFVLDLKKLQKVNPLELLTQDKIVNQQLKRISNFSNFLNNDLQIYDISYYRLKYSLLIDIIHCHLIYYDNNQVQFHINLPIEQSTFTRKQIINKSQKKQLALNKLQRFFRYQFWKQHIVLKLQKTKQLNYQSKQIIKIDDTYYIAYGCKQQQILYFKLIEYQNKSNLLRTKYELKNEDILNIGNQSLLSFFMNKLYLKDGQLQFKLQQFVPITIQEQNKDFRVNKHKRLGQQQLVNLRNDGQVLYNVIYSKRKLQSQSIDYLHVDINLNKLKDFYKSKSQKRDLISSVAESSLLSIKYEDDQVYVDQSKIAQQYVKLKNKPQFKLNQSKMVLKQRQRQEILVKTSVRFNKNKYLLQIVHSLQRIRKIIPDSVDSVFYEYEQQFIINSIELSNKQEINVILSNDQAIKLTQLVDKQKLAERLLERLQILNDRFLYLIKEENINIEIDKIILIKDRFIKMLQRKIRNLNFIKNYRQMKYFKLKYPQYILQQVTNLRTQKQYLAYVVINEIDKLIMYAWELQGLNMLAVELPKQFYLNYWNTKNKILCAEAFLHLVVLASNKIYIKKISPDAFGYLIDSIQDQQQNKQIL